MKPFLKYYIGYKSGRLFLDSIACVDNELTEPKHFVKWYEDGDLEETPISEKEMKAALCCDSPVFVLAFRPRKVKSAILEMINENFK